MICMSTISSGRDCNPHPFPYLPQNHTAVGRVSMPPMGMRMKKKGGGGWGWVSYIVVRYECSNRHIDGREGMYNGIYEAERGRDQFNYLLVGNLSSQNFALANR